jgi:bifunctional non-homologous end joining protein LigD
LLFEYVKPMEPVPAAVIPRSPDYLFQVKWDGVRLLAHVQGQRVWLHNRKLHNRTAHYPELTGLNRLIAGEAVLDGEIVAMRDGRPNFPLVLTRDLVNPRQTDFPYKIRRLMTEAPVCYLVFDLLWHAGQDLRSLPLLDRQNRLAEILRNDDTVYLVENFADGEKLFTAIAEQKLEGIVAKKTDSSYIAGKKHTAWLKIKHRQQQLVVIGGYTMKNGQINALLAGAYYQEKLIYVGKVAAGLSLQQLRELTPFLQKNTLAAPPFANLELKNQSNIYWVKPLLTAVITFQEWTDDLRMRHPVLSGFTKEEPAACILT